MALVVLWVSAGQLFADEILLENGNVLTGTIEKIDGGKLFLKTDYSQPIEIQVGKIKKITTDNPVDLYLGSGEVLKGKIKTVEEGKIAVEPAPGQAPTTVASRRLESRKMMSLSLMMEERDGVRGRLCFRRNDI